MKRITRTSHYIPNQSGNLSSICLDGSKFTSAHTPRVGSYTCTDMCPAFLFRLGDLIFCAKTIQKIKTVNDDQQDD